MSYTIFSGAIDLIIIALTALLVAWGPYGWVIVIVWRLYAIQKTIEERDTKNHTT